MHYAADVENTPELRKQPRFDRQGQKMFLNAHHSRQLWRHQSNNGNICANDSCRSCRRRIDTPCWYVQHNHVPRDRRGA